MSESDESYESSPERLDTYEDLLAADEAYARALQRELERADSSAPLTGAHGVADGDVEMVIDGSSVAVGHEPDGDEAFARMLQEEEERLARAGGHAAEMDVVQAVDDAAHRGARGGVTVGRKRSALEMGRTDEVVVVGRDGAAGSTSRSSIRCEACGQAVDIDELYILDDCSHKYCPCIRAYVASTIVESVNVACPVCSQPLSVRDMKELLPKRHKARSSLMPTTLSPHTTSAEATSRLMSELMHIAEAKPEEQGYSVEPRDDDVYVWRVLFFGFEDGVPLAADLKKMRKQSIELRVTFQGTYPHTPPFIRVIKPRFQYRTGHITIGGSICTELLTNTGWSSANTMEAVLLNVRAQMVVGGGRLDLHNKNAYSESEARVAFNRMVQQHGW